MMRMLPYLCLLLTFTFSGFSKTSCDFTGSWTTNWGTLELKSISNDYTGTYFSEGIKRGTIKGKMTADWAGVLVYLKGTWEQGKATGKFELKRNCSSKKFTCTWTNDKVEESGDWNGEKI